MHLLKKTIATSFFPWHFSQFLLFFNAIRSSHWSRPTPLQTRHLARGVRVGGTVLSCANVRKVTASRALVCSPFVSELCSCVTLYSDHTTTPLYLISLRLTSVYAKNRFPCVAATAWFTWRSSKKRNPCQFHVMHPDTLPHYCTFVAQFGTLAFSSYPYTVIPFVHSRSCTLKNFYMRSSAGINRRSILFIHHDISWFPIVSRKSSPLHDLLYLLKNPLL